MRVAVVADIGQPVYHVGDEAIGHAAREQLESRGVRPLMLTRDVAHTHQHFGEVDAAPTLQFPWSPRDRERYLGEIEDVVAGRTDALPPHDQAFGLIDRLREVDAVLIAGGGNLNSPYGWLLYERVATAAVARALGKPVVVTGQTLGPTLSSHDRRTVARLLEWASLVSLRESSSVTLARSIAPEHPAIVGGLDDAFAWRADAPDAGPGTRIVATFSPGGSAGVLGRALDHLAERHDLVVDLVPHMATPGERDGDVAFHEEVAASARSGRVVSLPLADAARAADAVGGAAHVVTSRYHPAVFAAARGVPVLALVKDAYSQVRIRGALAHHGLRGFAAPLVPSSERHLARALDEVWRGREEVAGHLATASGELREGHERRWDEIVAALSGERVAPSKLPRADRLKAPRRLRVMARAGAGDLAKDATAAKEAVEEDRVLSYR